MQNKTKPEAFKFFGNKKKEAMKPAAGLSGDSIKEWSEDQKCKLLKIALENNQVTYILKDADVRDFYCMICKNSNSEEAKRIKEIIYEKE